MEDDTAAILSGIDYPPEEWESADFHYLEDGHTVVVDIEMDDGTIAQIVCTDHDMADEVWDYCEDYDVERDSDYEGD